MAQFIDNVKEICNLKDFNPIGIKILKYVYSLEEIIKTNNYNLSKLVFKSTFGEPGKISIRFNDIDMLLDAINSNNNDLIYLVLSYYNLHIIYENINDILCCLIRNSNFKVCKTILYNYNITFKDNRDLDYNYTPLYCAVKSGNFKFVKLLLNLGADPNVWSNIEGYPQGKLPLHAAIKTNNYKIAKLLVLNGADPNLSENIIDYDIYNEPIIHNSPLHYGIRDYKIKFIKLFKHYCKSITNDEYLELKKEKKNSINFISDYTECQYNLLWKYD